MGAHSFLQPLWAKKAAPGREDFPKIVYPQACKRKVAPYFLCAT